MGEIFSVNSNSTGKGVYDSSRPAPMIDADKIYTRLLSKYGAGPSSALGLLTDLKNVLVNTKFHEVDTVWDKIETQLNGGTKLSVQATTGIGQYNTAFSLFYSALETIDAEPSYDSLVAFRELYFDTSSHVDGKISSHFSTDREGRVLDRILATLDSRVEKVTQNYNQLVEDGEIQGPAVPL